MYRWRKLSDEERRATLADRLRNRHPWHRPANFESDRTHRYLITAACYEHQPIIGKTDDRMRQFQSDLLDTLSDRGTEIHAWCILPNHYHALIQTEELKALLNAIGKLHGRTSHAWNGEDEKRGRKIWHGVTERAIRSERHYFATLNYIHHNPVKHGNAEKWQDWESSSVHEFLADTGREDAKRLWREYPILGYGDKWDP